MIEPENSKGSSSQMPNIKTGAINRDDDDDYDHELDRDKSPRWTPLKMAK